MMPRFEIFRPPSELALNSRWGIVAFVATFCTVAYLAYLLLWSGDAWLHPEIFGSSSYVWTEPNMPNVLRMLRRMFDWKAFDPNVNRVRPLNDLFEVIDAIARPYFTMLFGAQPSLNISTILTLVLVPGLTFGWLRYVTGSRLVALLLTLVLVSTTGFLSVTVAYLHPAKKLNLISLCGCLYFAERTARTLPSNNREFHRLCLMMLGGLLSDELALGNYITVLLLYWRVVFRNKTSSLEYLALPIVFLMISKWLLPAAYLVIGLSGRWDAVDDWRKFAVFGYLVSLEFQLSAAIQLARSMLSTLGVWCHTAVTEALCLLALIAAVASHLFIKHVHGLRALASDRFLMSTAALILGSGYATLLDWFPFPHEISYLGSFNYYYHSPVVLLVVGWLACGISAYELQRQRALLCTACLAVVVLNFATFKTVNELVEVIHYYPYSAKEFYPASRNLAFVLHPTPNVEEKEFDTALKQIFGDRAKDNGFYITHELLKPTPLMTPVQIDQLRHIFRPWPAR